MLLTAISLPAAAQERDTTTADIPPADSVEIQSPIDPPDDTPDHCPDPGDYPDPDEWTLMQSTAEDFITNPRMDFAREDVGAQHLTIDQLHPLLDATDAETCRQIEQDLPVVPPGTVDNGQHRVVHAYFQAGNFYFAVTNVEPTDPDEIIMDGAVLHVYDADLTYLTGFLY